MPKSKKIIITLLILAIIGVATAIIFLLITDDRVIEADPRSFEEIFWDSETAEEAIKIFQKKIDFTQDPEKKATFLTERSKFLYELPSNGDNIFKDQILSDLLEADNLEKSADSAYILYDRYSFFGDEEKSEYYLKLYYSRTGANEQ